MNRLVVLYLLTALFSLNAFSQSNNCDCKSDLIFLDAKIKKTPAYKNNKESYIAEFERLSNKLEQTTSIYDCFVLLNTLMLSLNDNHSRMHGSDKGAVKEVKSDSLKYATFKNSQIYNAYPMIKMDLDSLATVLNSKAVANVEGVYNIKDFLTIGFYKDNTQQQYKAVVLNSETEVWRKGELLYTAIPFGRNYYLNIGGSLSTKQLVAYTERVDKGIFHHVGFTKNQDIINYALKLPTDKTYYRDEITPEITYLRIGSFSGWHPTLGEAETFYKQLEGTLNKPHIILDLRNNGGGGDRNSDILYKLLKRFAEKNSISILVNHRTASNAEQFAFKLSKLNNCKIFGQQTNGTASYEIVNGSFELPSGHFMSVLTSKVHSKYLEIESKGVQPDVELSLESDWIEQIVKLTKGKHQG
jgi:hypothetical protein